MHHRDVQFAVGHGCIRSDERVVAVLGGIAHYHKESAVRYRLSVDFDDISFRREAHIFVDHAFEIHHQPAAFLAGEAFAHGGIESHTEGAEERFAVGCAVIGGYHVVLADYSQRTRHIDRDAQMPGKPVAAAAGDNAQRGSGADESAGSFVHGAVAAGHQNTVETAVFGNFDGNGGGVPWAIGGLELYVVAVTGQTAQHIGDDAVLRNCAGGRIHYERYLFAHCMVCQSAVSENSIRYALMKSSSFPSITPPTSAVCQLVRWSFTRRSSNT